MIIAGVAYFIGAGLQAGSHSNTLSMIFLGRIFWGIGVGFGDHCESPSPAQTGGWHAVVAESCTERGGACWCCRVLHREGRGMLCVAES